MHAAAARVMSDEAVLALFFAARARACGTLVCHRALFELYFNENDTPVLTSDYLRF